MCGMSRGWQELQRSFVAGALVVVPVAASVFFALWIFEEVTNLLLPPMQQEHATLAHRLLALAVFVALAIGVGWVMRWVAAKRLMAASEEVIGRVPLWSTTYRFAKEVSDAVLGREGSVFRGVALVEYPRPGLYTLGLIAASVASEAEAKMSCDLVSVFIPMSPHPITGYLALFPRERIVPLDMCVVDAVKVILSCGAVVPVYPEAQAAPEGPQG
jgi:uncharacterized membrane protein